MFLFLVTSPNLCDKLLMPPILLLSVNVHHPSLMASQAFNLGLNLDTHDYSDKECDWTTVGWLCYFEYGVLDDFSHRVTPSHLVYIVTSSLSLVPIFMCPVKCFCLGIGVVGVRDPTGEGRVICNWDILGQTAIQQILCRKTSAWSLRSYAYIWKLESSFSGRLWVCII